MSEDGAVLGEHANVNVLNLPPCYEIWLRCKEKAPFRRAVPFIQRLGKLHSRLAFFEEDISSKFMFTWVGEESDDIQYFQKEMAEFTAELRLIASLLDSSAKSLDTWQSSDRV